MNCGRRERLHTGNVISELSSSPPPLPFHWTARCRFVNEVGLVRPPPYSRPSKTRPPPLLPPALLAMPPKSLLLPPTLEAAPTPEAEVGLRRDREKLLFSAFSLLPTCWATAFARRLSRSSSWLCWVSASWISDNDSYTAEGGKAAAMSDIQRR